MLKSMLAALGNGRFTRVVQGKDPNHPQGSRERRRRLRQFIAGKGGTDIPVASGVYPFEAHAAAQRYLTDLTLGRRT